MRVKPMTASGADFVTSSDYDAGGRIWIVIVLAGSWFLVVVVDYSHCSVPWRHRIEDVPLQCISSTLEHRCGLAHTNNI